MFVLLWLGIGICYVLPVMGIFLYMSCFSGGSQGSVRKSLFLQGKVEASAYDRDRLGLSLQLVDIACVKTMPTAVQCRVCGVSGRKLFDPDIHSEILLASRE